jgi:hypothetical protein
MSSITTKRMSTYNNKKNPTTKRLLATGEKKVTIGASLNLFPGRPCLDKRIQNIIRDLRQDGATLIVIARICRVSMPTVAKYSWNVPHKNRHDVAMRINRKTGKRM